MCADLTLEGRALQGRPIFTYLGAWMVIPSVALAYGSNAFLRLILYFVPLLSVGLAQVPIEGRRSDRGLAIGAMLVLALGYFLGISFLRPEWFRVTPYDSVLQ